MFAYMQMFLSWAPKINDKIILTQELCACDNYQLYSLKCQPIKKS